MQGFLGSKCDLLVSRFFWKFSKIGSKHLSGDIQLYNVIHHFWKTNIIQPTSGTSGPLHIEWSDTDFVWALDFP